MIPNEPLLNLRLFLRGSTVSLDIRSAPVVNIDFLMRAETRRFGAKCIARMLPDLSEVSGRLLDFCPDQEAFEEQRTASTPLISPIIMRMVLSTVLMIEFLTNEEGVSQEVGTLPFTHNPLS